MNPTNFNNLEQISNYLLMTKIALDDPKFSNDQIEPSLKELETSYTNLTILYKNPACEHKRGEIEKTLHLWKELYLSYQNKNIEYTKKKCQNAFELFKTNQESAIATLKNLEFLLKSLDNNPHFLNGQISAIHGCLTLIYTFDQASSSFSIFNGDIMYEILSHFSGKELEDLMLVCKLFHQKSWVIITQRNQLTKEAYRKQQKMIYQLNHGLFTQSQETRKFNVQWDLSNRVFQAHGTSIKEINDEDPNLPSLNTAQEKAEIHGIAANEKFLFVGVGNLTDPAQGIEYLSVRDITKTGMPEKQRFDIKKSILLTTSKNFLFTSVGEAGSKVSPFDKFKIWKINDQGIEFVAEETHESYHYLLAHGDWLVSGNFNRIKLWTIGIKNISLKKEIETTCTQSLAFYHNCLIEGGMKGFITIWNLENLNNPPLSVSAHDNVIFKLSVFQNLLFSADWNGKIKIWNLKDPKLPCISNMVFSGKITDLVVRENYLIVNNEFTLNFKNASEVLLKLLTA